MEESTGEFAEYTIRDDWDSLQLYEYAKSAFETRNLKQAIKLSEQGLKQARNANNTKWIKEFDILHSEIKRVWHERKAESYFNRANKEESVYKYERAHKFIKKAKKHLESMYKLGKNQSKIKKLIKKADRKLSEIAQKDTLRKSEVVLQRLERSKEEIEDSSKDRVPNDNFLYTHKQPPKTKSSIQDPQMAPNSVTESGITVSMVSKQIPKQGSPKYEKRIARKPAISSNPKKASKKREDFKVVLDRSTSLSIDGSDVAWMGGKNIRGNKPRIQILIELKKTLEQLGFTNITLFCDYSLPWQIDDREALETMILNKEIIQVDKGEEADSWVLDNAKNQDGYIIVESEKYEDWNELYGEQWIYQRRIKCKYINGKFLFHPKLQVKDTPLNNPSSLFFSQLKKPPLLKENKNPILDNQLIEGEQTDLEEVFRGFLKDEEEEDLDPVKLEAIKRLVEEEFPQEFKNNHTFMNEEHTEPNMVNKLLKQIRDDFIKEKFYILSTTASKKICPNVDLFAFKISKISEYVDIIIVIPLKISRFKGSFIYGEKGLDYISSVPERKLNIFEKKAIIKPNELALSESFSALNTSLYQKGIFFSLLKNYIKNDIHLEPILSRAQSILHSGLLEYRIVIHPVLISIGETGSIHTSLIFPYDQRTNIYILQVNRFKEFIKYLQKKYRYLEANKVSHNRIKDYFDALDRFTKNMKNYSFPFLLYGVLISILFLVLGESAFQIFIIIGVGLSIFYSAMVGYLYALFLREQKEINKEIEMPHHLRIYNLDETDLLFLGEEFTPDLLKQIIFECKSLLNQDIFIEKRETRLERNKEPSFRSEPRRDSEFIEYHKYLE
ncbi:MAG: NYN domain-containing protein [Promethearchaeota archaeon]